MLLSVGSMAKAPSNIIFLFSVVIHLKKKLQSISIHKNMKMNVLHDTYIYINEKYLRM